jgi:hypothetical protein
MRTPPATDSGARRRRDAASCPNHRRPAGADATRRGPLDPLVRIAFPPGPPHPPSAPGTGLERDAVRIARPPTGTERQPRRRRAGHAILLVIALSRVLVAQDGPNAHTSLHDLTTEGPVAARNVPPVAAEPDAVAPPLLEDPELAARFQAEVDAAVERALDARLAGIHGRATSPPPTSSRRRDSCSTRRSRGRATSPSCWR